jgi:pimeloyl-ACP methyl ester carboxylesterase
MRHQAILLPGSVLPKDLAYEALIEALGDKADVRAKNLEVYATDQPPAGYGLETEIDGVLREADSAGFERFHLVGYSGGGAISTALVAAHPERVLSLALLEPAWIGNQGLSDSERGAWAEFERIRDLPAEEMMPRFIRTQLAPGVEPPPPPPGPVAPWMAKRPGGIRAITAAFQRHDLDPEALRAFDRPVYYALGALSNPEYYGEMAKRLRDLFPDYRLEVYDGRHHFDPPHRVEPERLAARLEEVWDRAAERDHALIEGATP